METRLPLRFTPEQVHQLYQENPENLVFVDLRDYSDFEKGHIAGSQWCPLSQVDLILEKDIGDKLLVLICEYEISIEALLRRRDIDHAVILLGGIRLWEARGFPINRLPNDKTKQKLS